MDLRTLASWAVIGCGAAVLVVLLFISAPYGRYRRAGWGPSMPTRLAWLVMESPAVWAFLLFYLRGPRWQDPVPVVLASLWLLHYLHRAIVYPFKRVIRPGDRTPLLVVAMAIVFNLVNAYVNGSALTAAGAPYDALWLRRPAFVIGATLFLLGYFANRQSDAILAELRRQHPGDGYAIPRGGLYRFISCPNYASEIVEWLGWALATSSLAGVSFCVFTTANLLPRALAHHRWYRRTFSDYPTGRRALVPFLL